MSGVLKLWVGVGEKRALASFRAGRSVLASGRVPARRRSCDVGRSMSVYLMRNVTGQLMKNRKQCGPRRQWVFNGAAAPTTAQQCNASKIARARWKGSRSSRSRLECQALRSGSLRPRPEGIVAAQEALIGQGRAARWA